MRPERGVCAVRGCGRHIGKDKLGFCNVCWRMLEREEQVGLRLAVRSPFWPRFGWPEEPRLGQDLAAHEALSTHAAFSTMISKRRVDGLFGRPFEEQQDGEEEDRDLA